MKKPGARPGNKNAVSDDPATANVVFRCTPDQKTTLIESAKQCGKTLTAFILGAAMAEIGKTSKKVSK